MWKVTKKKTRHVIINVWWLDGVKGNLSDSVVKTLLGRDPSWWGLRLSCSYTSQCDPRPPTAHSLPCMFHLVAVHTHTPFLQGTPTGMIQQGSELGKSALYISRLKAQGLVHTNKCVQLLFWHLLMLLSTMDPIAPLHQCKWVPSLADSKQMKWNKEWQGLDSGATCCSITALPYLNEQNGRVHCLTAAHTHSHIHTFFSITRCCVYTFPNFPLWNLMKTLRCGSKLRGNVLSVPSVHKSQV